MKLRDHALFFCTASDANGSAERSITLRHTESPWEQTEVTSTGKSVGALLGPLFERRLLFSRTTARAAINQGDSADAFTIMVYIASRLIELEFEDMGCHFEDLEALGISIDREKLVRSLVDYCEIGKSERLRGRLDEYQLYLEAITETET